MRSGAALAVWQPGAMTKRKRKRRPQAPSRLVSRPARPAAQPAPEPPAARRSGGWWPLAGAALLMAVLVVGVLVLNLLDPGDGPSPLLPAPSSSPSGR